MPRALLFALLLTTGARALPVPELRLVHPTFPDAMSAYDRGRGRLYLETNSLGCILAQKSTPQGQVTLSFDVRDGKVSHPKATTRDALARRFARCLPGMLKSVGMPTAPASWRFEATVALGGDYFDVDVSAIEGPVEKLPASARLLRNILVAALETKAPCTDALFAETPAMSYVLLADGSTAGDGAFSVSNVRESTSVPPNVVACLAERLEAARFTSPAALEGRLRLLVLRPSTDPGDGDAVILSAPD